MSFAVEFRRVQRLSWKSLNEPENLFRWLTGTGTDRPRPTLRQQLADMAGHGAGAFAWCRCRTSSVRDMNTSMDVDYLARVLPTVKIAVDEAPRRGMNYWTATRAVGADRRRPRGSDAAGRGRSQLR